MGIVDPLDPLYQWPQKQPQPSAQQHHHHHQNEQQTLPHVSKLTLLHALLLLVCLLLLVRIMLLRAVYWIISFCKRFFSASSRVLQETAAAADTLAPEPVPIQANQQRLGVVGANTTSNRFMHGASFY